MYLRSSFRMAGVLDYLIFTLPFEYQRVYTLLKIVIEPVQINFYCTSVTEIYCVSFPPFFQANSKYLAQI